MTVWDDTQLGDAPGDALTVNATSTFNAPVTIENNHPFVAKGSVTIGDGIGSESFIVNSTSTFNESVTIGNNKNLTVTGNTYTKDISNSGTISTQSLTATANVVVSQNITANSANFNQYAIAELHCSIWNPGTEKFLTKEYVDDQVTSSITLF